MSEFTVDISKLSQNRKNGVSGMMRVKNDAEFIKACVESCIDALDELIIVYNDCSDKSPEIIKEIEKKYPEKIKSYEYKPKIIAWNLDENTVKKIFNKEILAENTLAGYYNYTLSKTTYTYVMKVDADQIYYTSKLKEICDCYRCKPSESSLNIFKISYILIIYGLLCVSCRLKKYIPFLYLNSNKKRYQKYLNQAIIKYKPNITMSGINTIFDEKGIFVPLGRYVNNGLNILPPFNGEGDHPIFKVSTSTYFVPASDMQYNKLINQCSSVIERLVGTGRKLSVGLMWIHLNACRKSCYNEQKYNMKTYPESFIKIDKFSKCNYQILLSKTDDSIFSQYKKVYFRFIYQWVDSAFLDFVNKEYNKLYTTSVS